MDAAYNDPHPAQLKSNSVELIVLLSLFSYLSHKQLDGFLITPVLITVRIGNLTPTSIVCLVRSVVIALTLIVSSAIVRLLCPIVASFLTSVVCTSSGTVRLPQPHGLKLRLKRHVVLMLLLLLDVHLLWRNHPTHHVRRILVLCVRIVVVLLGVLLMEVLLCVLLLLRVLHPIILVLLLGGRWGLFLFVNRSR